MGLKILPQFQEEEDQNREERLELVFEARVGVEEGRRAKEATVSDVNVFNTRSKHLTSRSSFSVSKVQTRFFAFFWPKLSPPKVYNLKNVLIYLHHSIG